MDMAWTLLEMSDSVGERGGLLRKTPSIDMGAGDLLRGVDGLERLFDFDFALPPLSEGRLISSSPSISP